MARIVRAAAKAGRKYKEGTKAAMKAKKPVGRAKGKAKAAPKTKAADAKQAKPRAKSGTVAYQSKYKRRNWAKRLVWKGIKKKTSTGLTARDLCINKQGKVVSKRKSSIAAKRYFSNHLDLWTESFMEARKVNKVEGFVVCKKTGTKVERSLQSMTRAFWDDAVAARIHSTLAKNPRLLNKIATNALQSSKGPAASSSASSSTAPPARAAAVEQVKEEASALTCELRPGDRVARKHVQGDAAGKVGVVERFQLGRVCVRLGDEFQSVKPEDLEKVGP